MSNQRVFLNQSIAWGLTTVDAKSLLTTVEFKTFKEPSLIMVTCKSNLILLVFAYMALGIILIDKFLKFCVFYQLLELRPSLLEEFVNILLLPSID